jgi:hypothetical protein
LEASKERIERIGQGVKTTSKSRGIRFDGHIHLTQHIMAAYSSSRNLAIWKELPRDLVEEIVCMAAEMYNDEMCCPDGQAYFYFVCDVFNRPIDWLIDYDAMLKETEDEWRANL